MKKIIFTTLILLGLFNQKIQAQFIKAELQASGLTCSMCSFATQKSLQTLDFIDSIGTDLDHTIFMIYFKPNSIVNLDKINQ